MPEPDASPKRAPGGDTAAADGKSVKRSKAARRTRSKEIGGPEGPEPTRYGDWERNGRCTDF